MARKDEYKATELASLLNTTPHNSNMILYQGFKENCSNFLIIIIA